MNVLEEIEERPVSILGAKYPVLADTVVENPRAVAFIVSVVFPKVKKIVAGGWRRFGHLDKHE